MSLPTLLKVQKLQAALHAKAKGSPGYRFYALYDKVYRADVLAEAYEQCRKNGGAAGIDGQTFEDIEAYGLEQWLGELAQELKEKRYRPQAVRRVYIPKPNGKQRPLGIPTVRDRVVQTAAVLVLEPIFEADLQPEQYAYRANRNALEAVGKVHSLVNTGHAEVVDADLSGYLETSSHYPLSLEDWLNKSGRVSGTLMRKPFLRPRHTCTASSSPRFTRCNTVWRVTPRSRVASIMGT
jgi:RNA-directed DNA polymerase